MLQSILQILTWNTMVATALAIGVFLLCSLPFARRRPAFRHTLWLLVLVKLITPPLIPVPVLSEPTPLATTADLGGLELEASAAAGLNGRQQGELQDNGSQSLPPQSQPSALPPHRSKDANRLDKSNLLQSVNLTQLAIAALGGLWLAVTIVLLGRSWWRVRQLSRLIHRASEGDHRSKQITRIAAARMKVKHVDVRVVEGRIPPMIWLAWTGPMIVFPKQLLEQLNDEQIACIACHELAHYIRRDQWYSTFALVVTAVFWWHPVAWLARREIGKTQELCCDEHVLHCCEVSRRSYLETLLQALDFIHGKPIVLAAPVSGFFDNHSMKSRFQAISSGKQIARNSRWTIAAIVPLFASLLCVPVTAQTGVLPVETGLIERSQAQPVEEKSGGDRSDRETKSEQTLFLHWFKPGYGGHAPPEAILTMKVAVAEEFDVIIPGRKPGQSGNSISGRIDVKNEKHWGQVDAHWQSVEQFSGQFVLEKPMNANVFTWSRGSSPTCIVLSRRPKSDLFIERATREFKKVQARIQGPNYLTDSSKNTLENAAIRLSSYAQDFGFHGSASLANAIHSNTNSIYDRPVSDIVSDRNRALCRNAVEAMFATAESKLRWNLNVKAAENELIDLKHSEKLRFVLDLGGGRKWDESTEVKFFLRRPPQKNNLDYRATYPPVKSFVCFEFTLSKLKFPVRGCAMVRSAVYRHPGATGMSRLPPHFFDLRSASNLPAKGTKAASTKDERTDDEE